MVGELGEPAHVRKDASAEPHTDQEQLPPLLLATTVEGAHSMRWPEGWAARGSWGVDVLVEWVDAVSPRKKQND